jgi:hypothetical protein
MMKTSLFLPWAIGLATTLLGTLTAAMIPKTVVHENSKSGDEAEGSWGVKSSLEAVRSVAALLLGNIHVLAMLGLVFVCQLGFDSVPTMLTIYISKRFGWTFSDVSLDMCMKPAKLTKYFAGQFSPCTRDGHGVRGAGVGVASADLHLARLI